MCALQVLEKVVQGALLLIKAYRAREAVDCALMLSLVRMLRDLGLYATHFQGPFLAASDSAYANDGLVLVGNSSVADALEQAERRLAEEAPLCREFLDPSTLEPALEVVEKQLIDGCMADFGSLGPAAGVHPSTCCPCCFSVASLHVCEWRTPCMFNSVVKHSTVSNCSI